MTTRIFENSLVAIVGAAAGAIATALINNLLLKNSNVNYWWIGALLGVLIAILLYFLYQQGVHTFPVKKWRVTNAGDGSGLRSGEKLIGRTGQTLCQFESGDEYWAVYGPGEKTHEAIRKGKYKAVFRIKINHKAGPNIPIIEISASAKTEDGLGTKYLAARTLSNIDFNEDDTFQDFPLYFETFDSEKEFELRIKTKRDRRTVTLDYVRVSRRLF